MERNEVNEMSPDCVFIVYGSLAPGSPNHAQVAGIPGEWTQGIIQGRLENSGWGSELGYPGYVASKDPEVLEVHLLFSKHLPDYWPTLDAFEGPDYDRITIDFTTTEGLRGRGNIYALKQLIA